MLDEQLAAHYVYHSNRLDGVTLTLRQTQEILAGGLTEPQHGEDGREFEVELVLGHRRALGGMDMIAESGREITQDDVQNLHKMLMGELLLSAGEYRECQLRYKGVLIPSPPEYLGERMAWFVRLLNTGLKNAKDAHRFSWRIHHEFITLHPFIEGNGRMARLLMNLARIRRKLEVAVIPYESRVQYGDAILEFQKQKIERAQAKASGLGSL
ncbi:MAG: Fic family protein [Planctomycetota bacterium]